MNYFSGIQSHTTIQFDEFNPMPKISRFLWGSWLKTESEPTFINKKSFNNFQLTPKLEYLDQKPNFISGTILENLIQNTAKLLQKKILPFQIHGQTYQQFHLLSILYAT